MSQPPLHHSQPHAPSCLCLGYHGLSSATTLYFYLYAILGSVQAFYFGETLMKAFPAPDLRREAAYSSANLCASGKGSKEVLLSSALP